VWVCEPTVPTLVLGSTQGDDVVDHDACRRAGVAVARRRSGGGAVLVEPGGLLWLDVLLPAGDPRWEVDVARAFLWLGGAWAAALADVGVGAEVHRGGLCTTSWSRLVCFGGLGTGEVVTVAGGPKLIGISQRRARGGARFQCAALARWEPDRLVGLLALPPDERLAATSALLEVAQGIPVPLDDLRAAVLDQLERR
jgi:lipoate-protein ligase A